MLAEWPLLRLRLLRSRLGLWLAVLTVALVTLERYASAPDPLATALDAGSLGGVLSVAYLAGSAADRRALSLLLGHPTTPLAVACGRWVAATGGAALAVLATCVYSAWTSGAVAASLGAALAGLTAAASVAAGTLALVWSGGNLAGGIWLAALALLGHLTPDSAIGVLHPGPLRVLAVAWLELAPGPARYRGVAWGHAGPVLHATAWVGIGLALAAWRAARWGRFAR